jgi:hypothetical protein
MTDFRNRLYFRQVLWVTAAALLPGLLFSRTFVKRLLVLVQRYQSKAILALVKKHMEATHA